MKPSCAVRKLTEEVAARSTDGADVPSWLAALRQDARYALRTIAANRASSACSCR